MKEEFPSILNSELSVQVLQRIAQSNPGSYSTKIAEELDKPQSSISRIIKQLNELNFTEKGERKKAQYYRLNYQGIAEFWFQEIKEELEELNREKDVELLQKNKEEIKELNIAFTKKMLRKCEINQKNLQNIIFDDFLSSLATNALQDEELLEEHEYLKPVKDGLVHLLRVEGYPEEFRECLKNQPGVHE
ncbi:hypothetical protein GKQ38_01200 [Candidatus Nanohaloarchaea archaeon]|nr:hypothetical protein GKQ38_01200 [Candidatus Nanohaloarchaea archaeon]